MTTHERPNEVPIIYIAGPYSGINPERVARNIDKAEQYAVEIARLNLGFFCPHLNSKNFHHYLPEVSNLWWRKMDMEFVAICDAMFMLPGWQTSEGAKLEYNFAEALGIPIFTSMHGLATWHESTHIGAADAR